MLLVENRHYRLQTEPSTFINLVARIWFKTGELPTRRTRCACTVLSNGAVIVAGGSAAINSSLSQAVEIAEFL